MKIGIKYKLFFILLTASAVAVAGMFYLNRISFEKSLLNFVGKKEMYRLEFFRQILEQEYEDRGSWDYLLQRPHRWEQLKNKIFKTRHRMGHSRNMGRMGMHGQDQPYEKQWWPMERFWAPPDEAPGENRGQPRDVLLLDADKKILFGPDKLPDPVRLLPIQPEDRIVGWVGLTPTKILSQQDEVLFFQRQTRSFLMISLSMLIIAGILAIWAGYFLERPIKALARGTRRLASGRFDTRMDVTSTDELGGLTRDFNALAQALDHNEQSRQQWVQDISHELRTPLAMMSGEIEALQDGVRKMTPDTLNRLQGDIQRLIRLVNDLNELSGTDLGALSYRKENLDLAELTQEVLDRFAPELKRREMDVQVMGLDRGRVAVFADYERITQLLGNLIENTLAYTDPGGRIKIEIQKEKDQTLLHVEDSAPGVPEESLGRLFDRLFRVDPSRNRSSGGSGLGLSICHNIVAAHGGTITARPSDLGGLWIKVCIPNETRDTDR